MPSPRFDVHDDASSHRNPAPMPGRGDDVEDAAHEAENLPSGCRAVTARLPPTGRPPAD